MLSPSASPVPAYTQLELFATTYGTFGEPSGTCPENCSPMSCCSGRLRNGSRHPMVGEGPRPGAPVSGDASTRTCQNSAFAPKNPRWTPASRACCTPSYIGFDQYSL